MMVVKWCVVWVLDPAAIGSAAAGWHAYQPVRSQRTRCWAGPGFLVQPLRTERNEKPGPVLPDLVHPSLAQRAQTPGQAGELEGVPAKHIHVVAHERERRTTSGSRNQCAEDHAERADLVLHGIVIVLAELYGPAPEDLPRQGVASLLQAGLRLDLPAVAGFVGQAQGVQGVGDPPIAGDGISSRSALYGKKNRSSSERCGTPRNAACPAACLSFRKFDRHPGPPNSRSTRPPKVLALQNPRSTPSP